MSAIIRAHQHLLAFKVSDELEHAYTHVHMVTVDVFNTIESTSSCREMRGYLVLHVRGGQKNNSPPSAPPKKQLLIASLL